MHAFSTWTQVVCRDDADDDDDMAEFIKQQCLPFDICPHLFTAEQVM